MSAGYVSAAMLNVVRGQIFTFILLRMASFLIFANLIINHFKQF